MIQLIITIEEKPPGTIHSHGKGSEVGGPPTNLEVEFTTELMKLLSDANKGGFELSKTNIPLTIITTTLRKQEDEHTDRS